MASADRKSNGGDKDREHGSPVDRSRPDTTGRSVQTGSGWNWQTGHTLPGEARGNTPTDRGAGADSTRTPQADKAPGFPLCPKGHDITGGSVNGRGEGNRRREKGGKRPSIEGTRPGKTGQKGSKVLLGSYRDAGLSLIHISEPTRP